MNIVLDKAIAAVYHLASLSVCGCSCGNCLNIAFEVFNKKSGAAIPTEAHSPINSQHTFMFVDAASETEDLMNSLNVSTFYLFS